MKTHDDEKLMDEAINHYRQTHEIEKTKISLHSDETIEMQIVKKLFSRRFKTKKQILKEYKKEIERRNVERYSPDINIGLNDEQVQKRIDKDFTNATKDKFTRPIWAIIVSNLFTYFNIIMIVIAIFLAAANARISNFFFLGIVLINTIIGIIQEIRSKKVIDKLKIVTSSKSIVIRNGKQIEIDPKDIVLDDIIQVKIGDQLVVDGIIKKGEVEVNESALTGESLPIKKKEGDLLLSGSYLTSGECIMQAEKVGHDTFSGNLSMQAKKYKKNTSTLKRSINAFITIVSIILIPVTIACIINNYLIYKGDNLSSYQMFQNIVLNTSSSVIGLIPSGLVLLVSSALAVGVIALAKRKTMVKDLYSIERLARVTTLCLDKTGTLTDGTMKVNNVIKCQNIKDEELKDIMTSYLNAFKVDNQTSLALVDYYSKKEVFKPKRSLPFSSSRKYSSVMFENNKTYALGAYEYIFNEEKPEIKELIEKEMSKGNRVVVLAECEGINEDTIINPSEVIAIFSLEDHIREEAYLTLKWFKENQVKIKIISGDNPITVKNIACKCGLENPKFMSLEGVSLSQIPELVSEYDIFGRVTPDQKEEIIKSLKLKGEVVAMTGDGVNDILAMKQADCSIAMNNGADATKGIAHLVLLDSNFASLPEVVNQGRKVVNNIQQSASLFLMKTTFIALLTLVWVMVGKILDIIYPFTPSRMLILEIFIIGLPAFFLSFQPNNKLIEGNFIFNVIKKAVPMGIVLFVSIFISMIIKRYVSGIEYNQGFVFGLEELILVTVGYILLIFNCLPLNIYRLIVLIASGICSFIGVLFLPEKIIGVNIINTLYSKGLYIYIVISIVAALIYFIYYLFAIRKIQDDKKIKSKA